MTLLLPSPWDGSFPYPFENWSGETIPAFSIMAVTDIVYTEGIPFFKVEKPSTTFRRRYVVNGHCDIPSTAGSNKGRGVCFERGLLRFKYESGASPSNGKGYGPKPGSWEMWEGYPQCVHVEGVLDSTNKWMLGMLAPITRLRCKTGGSSVSAGTSSSSNYIITTGTPGSEATAGFTTLPTMYYRTAIGANKHFFGSFLDGYWYAEPQEC